MLPFVADLPPLEQERIVCSISSAVKYQVPANIVLAVAEKEGGKPGQWVRNSNGTHDIGPMQFNTAYLRELERYGITANDVAAAGCYAFDLAAWRLRRHLRNDRGDLWTRAANYHSRTPRFNVVYRADLMKKATKWADWLEARFVTVDVTQEGAAPSTPTKKAVSAATASATRAAQSVTPRSTRTTPYVPRQITFTRSAE